MEECVEYIKTEIVADGVLYEGSVYPSASALLQHLGKNEHSIINKNEEE